EAEMQVALDENRNAIFARRLEIQDALVAIFRQAWRECERSAPSPSPLSSRVLPEFEQPSRERPTLLPDGLVRNPLVYVFEHGLFFGRLTLAGAFIATLQIQYLGWGLLLFVLD